MRFFQVYGYAPKGSIAFFCQAVDEKDVRKQFEAAIAQAKKGVTWQSGFGQLLWDYPMPGDKDYGPSISLLYSRPQPSISTPLQWGGHDYELSIREIELNHIMEHP